MVRVFLVTLLLGLSECARISRQQLQMLSMEESTEQSAVQQPAQKQWVRVGQDNTVCDNGWAHKVKTEAECKTKAMQKGRQYYSFSTYKGGRCKYEKKCKLKSNQWKNWNTYRWQEVVVTVTTTAAATTTGEVVVEEVVVEDVVPPDGQDDSQEETIPTTTEAAPQAFNVTVSGSCIDADNGRYIFSGNTANGAKWYSKADSDRVLYYDLDCNGGGTNPRWIVGSATIDPTRQADLDNRGACSYRMRVDSSASILPTGAMQWRVACNGAWEDRMISIVEATVVEAEPAEAKVRPGAECQPLEFYEACATDATWAYTDGRHQDWAVDAYAMLDVPLDEATQDDFQKLFYCGMERQCAPPCQCSKPPCNVCPGLHAPDDLEDAELMAGYLNDLYYGFKKDDSGSPNGVYMTMHNKMELHNHHDCHNGWTNERMSASIYNHLMMLSDDMPKITMKRHTGFVFNAALVDSRLGKCSYMFDGATFNRFNRACGCNSHVNTCGKTGTAYDDLCGKDYDHDCGPQDHKEVEMCSCDTRGVDEVQQSTQIQCFFKGPAYDEDNIDTANDQTRTMIEERLKRQNLTSGHGPQLEIWNELVVDTALLEESLLEDPNGVIHAFTYVMSSSWGKNVAKSMRDKFMKEWNVTTKIPVLGVNDRALVSEHEPFFVA